MINFLEILKIVFGVIIFIWGFVWIISLVFMVIYRHKEEKIREEWEIEKVKVSKGVAMPVIEGRWKVLAEKYQSQIDSLERKRQFLRDITPLIKK